MVTVIEHIIRKEVHSVMDTKNNHIVLKEYVYLQLETSQFSKPFKYRIPQIMIITDATKWGVKFCANGYMYTRKKCV